MPLRIGGYSNNRPALSAEHDKLPAALRRRVSQGIRVISVTDTEVVYRTLATGRTHRFRLTEDGWRWAGEVRRRG